MNTRLLLAVPLACTALACATVHAATVTYDYDALGRLTRVTYPDGKVVIYSYDAAGNRTQVSSGTQP